MPDQNVPLTIGICHGNQLLAECMALTLSQCGAHKSEVYAVDSAIEDVTEVDVLLLEASLEESILTGVMTYARQLNPSVAVLLIVPLRTIDRMLAFTRVGAQGCIVDQCNIQELQQAVAAVAAGEIYCSSMAAQQLFRQAGESPADRLAQNYSHVRLTAREREILELIAWEKLGNKQIAYRLSISLYTVKNHVHNLIEKLGVTDRHEAVQRANRLMLLGER